MERICIKKLKKNREAWRATHSPWGHKDSNSTEWLNNKEDRSRIQITGAPERQRKNVEEEIMWRNKGDKLSLKKKKKKKWGLRLKQLLECQRKKSEEKILIWTHYRENVEISRKERILKHGLLTVKCFLRTSQRTK